MSQAPYMPVFTDALLGDTTHLTAEEFGSYCLILFATWRNNGVPFPDDDNRLRLVVRCSVYKWRRLRRVLVKFFNLDDGTWRQKRLEKEWRRTQKILAAQHGNAGKRAAASPKISDKIAIRSENFCEISSSKFSANELKSLEPDPEMAAQSFEAKGEAKKEENLEPEPSESVAAREGFSIDERGLGVASLPSEPAAAPEPEPAASAAGPPTAEDKAYVDALVEQTTAAVRGDVPKGIRDPAAYKAAIKDAKFTSLVKNVNAWVGTALSGETQWAAWEVLDAAEKAGARSGMSRAARKDFDRLDAMYRATGPPDDMAQAA